MNRQTTELAIDAAERFVVRARALLDTPTPTYDCEAGTWTPGPWQYPVVGTRLSGAARRASMDLTRALAEMRRP